MFDIEVVKCSSVDHKLKCLDEAIEAVRRAKGGNKTLGGRKVTIRGAITDPCSCHLDALIWMASDMLNESASPQAEMYAATLNGFGRLQRSEMH